MTDCMETLCSSSSRQTINASVPGWFFRLACTTCMSKRPFRGESQTISGLTQDRVSFCTEMANHSPPKMYGSHSTSLKTCSTKRMSRWTRVEPKFATWTRLMDYQQVTVFLSPSLTSHTHTDALGVRLCCTTQTAAKYMSVAGAHP